LKLKKDNVLFILPLIMLKVGLTGGIGSGKTTVAGIFSHLGVPVFFADIEAKKAYHTPEIRARVIQLLGDDSYHGLLPNIPLISSKVFNDAHLLQQLNHMIHPEVGRLYQEFCDHYRSYAYTLKEAAILFESGTYKDMDSIILVTADLHTRINRVMQRDGVDDATVRSRIAHQMGEADKMALSDYVIHNDGQQPLIQQVLDVHHELLKAGG
jgi:dephospho-CoA kinase